MSYSKEKLEAAKISAFALALEVWPKVQQILMAFREAKADLKKEKETAENQRLFTLRYYRAGELTYPPCNCHDWTRVKVVIGSSIAGPVVGVLWSREFDDDDAQDMEESRAAANAPKPEQEDLN